MLCVQIERVAPPSMIPSHQFTSLPHARPVVHNGFKESQRRPPCSVRHTKRCDGEDAHAGELRVIRVPHLLEPGHN